MRALATSFLLALLAGAVLPASLSSRSQNPPVPVGDALVDIGGRRLHVSCVGAGNPTVILEAGMGESAVTWKAIQPAVAEFTRVCAYDRAARGTSDPDPMTDARTARAVVDDLGRLLRAAAITGPYVLVGHSFGGAYIRSYASRFPRDVVGIVLVDSTHEDQYAGFASTGYVLPPMPADQNPERTDVVAALKEVSQEKWRADIPLVVLTHGRPIAAQAFPNITPEQATRIESLWLDLQRDLAGRSPQGRLVIAEKSGHYVHYEEPALVIQAIRDVVAAARKK
jgi:pimeloyl-ACP methyl ester carboxylesterase